MEGVISSGGNNLLSVYMNNIISKCTNNAYFIILIESIGIYSSKLCDFLKNPTSKNLYDKYAQTKWITPKIYIIGIAPLYI